MTDQYAPPAPPAPNIPEQAPAPRRRRLILTIVIVVVVLALSYVTTLAILGFEGSTSKPVVYQSTQFKYLVTFPGQPTVAKRTGASGQPAATAQWTDGGKTATVEAEELPNQVAPNRMSVVLSAALDGGASNLHATNIQHRMSFKLDGQPAMSEEFDAAVTGHVYEAVSIKGTVVYVILTTAATSAYQTEFVDSFKFSG